MDKELIIELKMDRSAAEAEARKFVEAQRANERKILSDAEVADKAKLEAIKRGNAQRVADAVRASQGLLSNEKVVEQARLEIVQRTNARRVAAAVQAAQGESAANAAGRLLNSTLASTAGQYFGIQAVGQALQEIGANIGRVYERAIKLADDFVAKREQLREVADIMGKTANTTFTVEQADFEAKTGMKPEEAVAFRREFHGSAASAIGEGKHLSTVEGKKFEEGAAQLAVMRGIDPAVTAQLAAATVKMEDFEAKGQGAAEALRRLDEAFAVLKAGSGDNDVLVRQLAMLSAAAVNEDAMLGVFPNIKEAAVATSVGAEKHDAQSAELNKAAMRGLRAFDDKDAGPLLQRAGIDKQTPYFEALDKLAPILMAETKANGGKLQDTLKTYFKDELTREGLAVSINRGVEGHVIRDREQAAEEARAEGPVAEKVAKFQNDPQGAGPHRMAEAGLNRDRTERGAKRAIVPVIQLQAEAELEKEGYADDPVVAFTDAVQDAATRPAYELGAAEKTKDFRLHKRMRAIIERRRLAAGLAPSEPSWHFDTNAEVAKGAEEIEAAGGNPVSDDVAVPVKAATERRPPPPAPKEAGRADRAAPVAAAVKAAAARPAPRPAAAVAPEADQGVRERVREAVERRPLPAEPRAAPDGGDVAGAGGEGRRPAGADRDAGAGAGAAAPLAADVARNLNEAAGKMGKAADKIAAPRPMPGRPGNDMRR